MILLVKNHFLHYNKLMDNQPFAPGQVGQPQTSGFDPNSQPVPPVSSAMPVFGAPSTEPVPVVNSVPETPVAPVAQPAANNPEELQGSVVEPAAPQPFGPAAPGTLPNVNPTVLGSNPQPLTTNSPADFQPAPAKLPRKKMNRNLVETIILVIVSLLAVTFIGLFIWKYLEWDNVKTDVDGQIDAAVAMAIAENTTKLENEFTEREKYPYKTFTGPTDYGSLSFEYPKTWNLYIDCDTSNGGDFEAYLNPGEVQPVSASTINALRVVIRDSAFDNVVRTYNSAVQSGRLSVVTRPIGNTVANVYAGELSNNIRGIVTIFKLRDKTVLLQTDAELFADEYYKLLDTVTFVE